MHMQFNGNKNKQKKEQIVCRFCKQDDLVKYPLKLWSLKFN